MSNKNILLIHPPFYIDKFAEHNHFKGWPHIGLLSLASYLRARDYNVFYQDYTTQPYEPAGLLKSIFANSIATVGITGTSPQYANVMRIIKDIKSRFDLNIVLGGAHASCLWQAVLQEEMVDYVVIGEGEITFYELLEYIRQNGKKKISSELQKIDGIAFNNEGKAYKNKARKYIENFKNMPLPAYELFDLDKFLEENAQIDRFRAIPYIISRGCPFDCTFCAVHSIMGTKVRYRSINQIVREISYLLKRYKAEGIWFKDSTFTIKRKWVLDFCQAIKDNKLKFKWNCNTRIDCLDEELLEHMQASGLQTIWFGIESGSNKILKELNKNYTKELVIKTLKLCKKFQINIAAWMIIGSENENYDDIRATVSLARESGIDDIHWHALVPLPGSRCFTNLSSEQKAKIDYEKLLFNKAVLDNKYFTKDEIQNILVKVLAQSKKGCYDENKI